MKAGSPCGVVRITRADDTIRLWKNSAMNPGDELAFNGNAISYDLSDDGQRNAFQSDIYNFAVSPPGPQNLWLSVTTNTTATSLTLAYINPLNETCSSVLTVTVAVVSINLVPDSNHDRVIDASDVTTNTFHFWINDDANSGDISSGNSDVPGQSGSSANYSSSTVCGRNDLLDFFPVWLDVSQAFNIFPTNSTTQIILKQADNAVKIVYTCLTKSQAGGYQINEDAFYGSTLCSYAYNADTVPVTSAGVVLPNNFLCQIAGNPNKGVLLVEGVATSSAPLVVEYWQNGQKVVSASMPMQTSTISDMYRWINLRGVTGGSVTVPTSTNQPPNYPDALCNGKQFVYTHGFMTSESCARSGASQVFKRLYHSGSRAMFTMVAWQGDVGTVPATCYHEDVRNAFAMASNYVAAVSQLPGQLYVGAHSLGNMLVSSAIVDYGLNPQNYFMFDAAVAVESYNGGVSNIVDMVPTAWTSYDPRLWASDWFKLFPGDARNNLTWQNRFGNIPQAVNYFSSGEDVLENNPSGTDLSLWSMMVNYAIAQLTDSGSGLNQVWIFQERSKGASFWNVADQNVDGGWVQNSCYSGLTLAQANALASSNSVLQTNAFFNPFVPSGLYTTNGSVIAASNNVRTELLAESIPAVSCPSGGNSVAYFGINNGAGSIDMMQNFENSDAVWPRQNSAWWHGDFKDVAYYYVYMLFDDIVTKGTLK
jgi:hypothetical protein